MAWRLMRGDGAKGAFALGLLGDAVGSLLTAGVAGKGARTGREWSDTGTAGSSADNGERRGKVWLGNGGVSWSWAVSP